MLSFLKKYIERRMNESGWWLNPLRGLSPFKGAAHICLYCLSLAYGLAVSIRLWLYGLEFLRSKALECKVISIGNITAGGSGKTPMAIYIADLLKKRGERVTVISRGYGRASSGVLTVSDGINILLGPREAGDEPYLMATRLKDIPVVVGEDRVKAGLFAIQQFNPTCIILDDGFQHLRLRRDLNILLVDAAAGFGNGFLLPRGILREPVSAVKRATFAMIKGNGLNNKAADIINRSGSPVVEFSYKPACLTHLSGNQTLPLTCLKGKRVIAVAAIANPESFFSTLQELEAEVVRTVVFTDHHMYSEADIVKIDAVKKAAPDADIIITTEKDGVKLRGLAKSTLDIYTLSIDVSISGKKEFEDAISTLLEEGR